MSSTPKRLNFRVQMPELDAGIGGVTLYESRGRDKYTIGQGGCTISADNARITIWFTYATGIDKVFSGMTVVYHVNDAESFYNDTGETWVRMRS